MTMHQYNITNRRRNKFSRGRRRPLQLYGPRYVKARRSTRITAVWTLRPRQPSRELPI